MRKTTGRMQRWATFECQCWKPAYYVRPSLLMLDLISAAGKDSIVNHIISHDTLVNFDMDITTVGRNWIYVKSNGKADAQAAASPQ